MFGGKERTKREEECIVAGIRFISWGGGGNEGKGGSNHDDGKDMRGMRGVEESWKVSALLFP